MKNAGFSLVEIMIVCAIMGVVALGISQMMIGQAKQQKNIQRKANFQQLVMATQSAASNPVLILNSSKGQENKAIVADNDLSCGTPPKACITGYTCVMGKCTSGGSVPK